MDRRGFLARATALTGAVVGGRWLTGFGLGDVGADAVVEPFPTPLPRPTVLRDEEIELVAAEAAVQIRPTGPPTEVWAFNGTFPGPTIRRPAGAATRVRVRHEVEAEPESLTIHLHGGHTEARFDGQPDREVIEQHGELVYEYALVEDGAPERGALQWYHDHSHLRTGRNLWNGLAGMFVIEDVDRDASLGLPTGDRDVELFVTDRVFGPANQFVYAFGPDASRPAAGPGSPPFADAIGNVVLVNGAERPHLVVEPGRYRFRLLNASNFRPYNFAIPEHGPVQQVATEAGLLPATVELPSVLLGPAERAEIVVDFTAFAGRDLLLESVALDESPVVPATGPFVTPVLQFRVRGEASDDDAPPVGPMPGLPEWAATARAEPHRLFAFGLGVDEQGRAAWTINGRAFDHSRVDARPELGATETWMLVNTSPTGTSHYIHIHGVDWLVRSRNGAPPGPAEAGLKDTFRLDPGEVLVLASKFTDHLGTFMIHCHMLEHEDHGMMTTFEVVEPGAGDLANPVPGVTSVLLEQVDPVARAQVAQVLAAVERDPGRPASTAGASTQLPTSTPYCSLGLD